MVCVLGSSVEDCGFESWLGHTKTLKLVFVISPLSIQHYGERAKTWLARHQDNVGQHVYPQTVVSVS
jgi:hypothetical protein